MKKDTRSKINQFLTSEIGQVGIRAPLFLGVTSGTILLSQMAYTPSAEANFECWNSSDCDTGESCEFWCETYSQGTCKDWRSKCVSSSDS